MKLGKNFRKNEIQIVILCMLVSDLMCKFTQCSTHAIQCSDILHTQCSTHAIQCSDILHTQCSTHAIQYSDILHTQCSTNTIQCSAILDTQRSTHTIQCSDIFHTQYSTHKIYVTGRHIYLQIFTPSMRIVFSSRFHHLIYHNYDSQ